MCGIVGKFNFGGDEVQEGEIHAMADIVAHRGPDDSGYYVGGNIGLGMRRLSIIDVAKGHQPVFNEDGTVVVVYNGEIYNYQALNEVLLQRGHVFKTHCDTETLVHMYEEDGPEFVRKLNGMFAFALWDMRKKRLLLARDRVGIKPLSYYLDQKRLIFGSEIKSILRSSEIVSKPNEATIRSYFIKSKYLSDASFFCGIVHLPPGHLAEVDINGIRVRQYWDATFGNSDGVAEADLLLQTTKTVDASVKRQLISDVPLGSYLSGGIDSSAVAIAAAKSSRVHLETFGAAFPEFVQHDEGRFQVDAANLGGTLHHQMHMTSEGLLDDFRKLIWHIDQPMAGVTIGQYRMARFASERVKVVLTGHGGDELFGGYPNHLIAAACDMFKSSDFGWKKGIGSLRGAARDRLLNWQKVLYNIMVFARKYRLPRSLALRFYENLLALRIFTFPFFLRTRSVFTHGRILDLVQKSNAHNWLERMLYVDIKLWLPNLLMVEDKESMAHSLEDRVPLLDNEVIDLALRVPGEMKIRNNVLKSFLRDSQINRLPESVLRHEKRGFPQPWAEWIREFAIRSEVESLIMEGQLVKRNILAKRYARNILKKHMNGNKDLSWELWQILSVEIWFRQYVSQSE